MGFIEDMKWWHWMVVSLVLGAVLGFINVHNVQELPLKVQPAEFEATLMNPHSNNGKVEPWIMNLKLFPPEKDGNGGIRQMVTYLWRNPKLYGKPEGNVYQPCSTVVTIPFVPRGSRNLDHLEGRKWPGTEMVVAKPGDTWQSLIKAHYRTVNPTLFEVFTFANLAKKDDKGKLTFKEAKNPTITPGYNYYFPWSPTSNHTLRDFLDEAAKNISATPAYKSMPNWATYQYQWWHDPKYAYWLFMSASFVVVGLIWPFIMRFLVAGGLGRAEPDNYDLSRFKGGKESKLAAAVVTDEDRQQLQELESTLEASLKASGTAMTAGKTQEQPDTPVKQLKAGPLEASKTAPPSPEEKKDFKGEFYPVARPGGKPEGKKD